MRRSVYNYNYIMFERLQNICGGDEDYTRADDTIALPRNSQAVKFVEKGLRNKFLNEYLHPTAISDDFLENVQQNVPLHKCKKVKKSSYFDQNMPFAAIVSELIDTKLM